jgi:hypothetical protein
MGHKLVDRLGLFFALVALCGGELLADSFFAFFSIQIVRVTTTCLVKNHQVFAANDA